jgi:hypothetical protein
MRVDSTKTYSISDDGRVPFEAYATQIKIWCLLGLGIWLALAAANYVKLTFHLLVFLDSLSLIRLTWHHYVYRLDFNFLDVRPTFDGIVIYLNVELLEHRPGNALILPALQLFDYISSSLFNARATVPILSVLRYHRFSVL